MLYLKLSKLCPKPKFFKNKFFKIMNITENLQRILQAKQNIAAAITEKGVECSADELIDTYAEKIQEISSGGGGGYGIITEQTEPKIFERKPDPKYMEAFCIIGALVSKDDNGNWTVWNTNPEEENYWDPKSDTITTPSTQYGQVIGICVGLGLWAYPRFWEKLSGGLTQRNTWCYSNTGNIYNKYHFINIHGTGWKATQHILTEHFDEISTEIGRYYTYQSIFTLIYENSTEDIKLYIPSGQEITEMFNNICDNKHDEEDNTIAQPHSFKKNIGNIIFGNRTVSSNLWTSSQFAGSGTKDYTYAMAYRPDYGYLTRTDKTGNLFCITPLVHFE